MQLNPARGRKLSQTANLPRKKQCQVYAAQPREGTETKFVASITDHQARQVYAAQPREGTETFRSESSIRHIDGLCSSTPRGDGNNAMTLLTGLMTLGFMQLNPARGRKL